MKRITAISLMLALVLTLLPGAVFAQSTEDILNSAKNKLTFSVLSEESIENVTKDLYLPSSWQNGTYIYWTSNNESLLKIDGEKGIVSQPPFGDGLSCVALCAHIGYDNQWINKYFLVRISELEIGRNYSSALIAARNEFDQAFVRAQNLLEIKDNLILPTLSNKAISVSFVSQNPDIITSEGKVTRSLKEDRVAEFVVNFSYGYERTRLSYALIVKATNSEEVEAMLKKDLDWVVSELNKNYNLNKLSEDIELPSSGPNGTVFSYKSSDTDVIEADGTIYPDDEKQTVELTVTASMSGLSDERVLNITVLPANSYQQGGSGGSGGGGGGGAGSSAGGGGGSPVSAGTGKVTMQMDLELGTKQVFKDVSNSHWANEAIMALKNKGIVSGDDTGNFRPDAKLTREELVKMVVLATNISLDGAEADFKDVDKAHWCYPYVAAGFANGIISGRDDGTFGRGASVTRQDAAVIIYNTMIRKNLNVEGSQTEEFADMNSVSDYAKTGVAAMKRIGLINGKGDNMFMPLDNLSRAEAAMMIWRMIK